MDQEINAIWLGRLTPMKFMYLLTRYSAIAEAGIVLARASEPVILEFIP